MSRFTDRAVPIVSIAALVGGLVLSAGLLKSLTSDNGPAAPSATAVLASSDDSVIDLDLGATDDLTSCLSPDFASDASSVTVLYGVQQRQLDGEGPVLVLRNATGDLRLCDASGPDSPAESPLPTASPETPVAFLSTGRSAWTCAGSSRTLDRFEQTTWLVTSPDVATVGQRYWVDGTPGPWFETSAVGGYAHLQTWLEGPEPAGTVFAQQYRVLDADGDVVPQTALPTKKAVLPGCSRAGSAQIG